MNRQIRTIAGIVVAILTCLPIRAERPNILVLMGDDWSWPHAGFLGDPVARTPTFDSLAESGLVIENAFVSAPSCTPSRFAIATGQWHWRLKEADSLGGSLEVTVPVYPELLRDNGYAIGFARKGAAPSQHQYRMSDPFGERFRSFEEFLNQQDADAPFCFWYGAGEPHRPYRSGTGIRNGFNPDAVVVPECLPDHPTVRSDLCDYYERVERFDQAAAKMLDLLRQQDRLRNTIVIVSGDNGMPFPRCKATLYDQGTRVPLVISWPETIKLPRTITDFVSLTDLAPTILEAAGVDVPDVMTGRSLLPLILDSRSGQIDPERTFTLFGMERHVYKWPCRAIRTKEYLYIRNFAPQRWPTGMPDNEIPRINFTDGSWPTFPGAFSWNIDPSPTKQLILDFKSQEGIRRFFELAFGQHPVEELYDLKTDPSQLKNVAGDAAHMEQRQQLAAQLDQELRGSEDPRFP